MKETFRQYVDRVSRARHLLTTILAKHDFYHGAEMGYESSIEYIQTSDQRSVWVKKMLGGMADHCRGKALTAKCQALIVQDRVLPYRENEL